MNRRDFVRGALGVTALAVLPVMPTEEAGEPSAEEMAELAGFLDDMVMASEEAVESMRQMADALSAIMDALGQLRNLPCPPPIDAEEFTQIRERVLAEACSA